MRLYVPWMRESHDGRDQTDQGRRQQSNLLSKTQSKPRRARIRIEKRHSPGVIQRLVALKFVATTAWPDPTPCYSPTAAAQRAKLSKLTRGCYFWTRLLFVSRRRQLPGEAGSNKSDMRPASKWLTRQRQKRMSRYWRARSAIYLGEFTRGQLLQKDSYRLSRAATQSQGRMTREKASMRFSFNCFPIRETISQRH